MAFCSTKINSAIFHHKEMHQKIVKASIFALNTKENKKRNRRSKQVESREENLKCILFYNRKDLGRRERKVCKENEEKQHFNILYYLFHY